MADADKTKLILEEALNALRQYAGIMNLMDWENDPTQLYGLSVIKQIEKELKVKSV